MAEVRGKLTCMGVYVILILVIEHFSIGFPRLLFELHLLIWKAAVNTCFVTYKTILKINHELDVMARASRRGIKIGRASCRERVF